MENEQTNKTDTPGNATDKPVENSDKPVSIVEEAAKIRDEIRAERIKLDEANTKKEKLQADEMLGGTGGGHVDTEPKPETDEKYFEKFKNGEVNPLDENVK